MRKRLSGFGAARATKQATASAAPIRLIERPVLRKREIDESF